MKELFIPIKEFEDYAVSELGTVKSFKRKTPKIIIGSKGKPGYRVVHLKGENYKKQEYIHHLVLKTFTKSLDKTLVTNHKDGNKLNNNITNLEQVSHKENINHAFKIGLHPLADQRYNTKILSKDIENIKNMRELKMTYSQIASKYGCSRHLISYICRGIKRLKG